MPDDLLVRKRRILWRARHRGMKETDMLFGRLAEEALDGLDAQGVTEFEALLDVPDTVFLAWISGEEEIPAGFRGPLMDLLLSYRFSADGHDRNGA